MALYLVRHGESVPKEINPACPLSDRGMVEVEHMAARAAEKDCNLTKIFHSGKKRALQTAMIIKEHLNPTYGIAEALGLNPNDDMFHVLSIIEKEANPMIVSHLPFLEKLASFLVMGDQEKSVVKFPTAGIVYLEKGGNGKWKIKWKLFP